MCIHLFFKLRQSVLWCHLDFIAYDISIFQRGKKYNINLFVLLLFFLHSDTYHFYLTSSFSLVRQAIYKIYVCLTLQWNNPIMLAMVNDFKGKHLRIQMLAETAATAAAMRQKKVLCRISKLTNGAVRECARELFTRRASAYNFLFILYHSIALIK